MLLNKSRGNTMSHHIQTALSTQKASTMIDVYFEVIKEKLAEKQINLDLESQSPADALITRHIENGLAEIVKFLR